MTREFVDRVISKFERGDILLLQNEINELSYIIDKAYERGLEIILNPSPYDQNLEGCDFGKISMFLLTGSTSVAASFAARRFSSTRRDF